MYLHTKNCYDNYWEENKYESFGRHTKWSTINRLTAKWSTTKWSTLSSPNCRYQIDFDCQLVDISVHGSPDFEASNYAVIFNTHQWNCTKAIFRSCFIFWHTMKPEILLLTVWKRPTNIAISAILSCRPIGEIRSVYDFVVDQMAKKFVCRPFCMSTKRLDTCNLIT